jgi:hypothetical protein
MSRATVKKMKVAAARRPGGGADGRVALVVRPGETSSGSVIRGSGAVVGGGFWGDSAMRLMAVYVSFVLVYWIFRRLICGLRVLRSVYRMSEGVHRGCVAGVLYWVRGAPGEFHVYVLRDEA